MAVKLNLLPPDLKVSKGLNTVIKTVRSINVILVVMLVVTLVSSGAFFIVSSIKLKNLHTDITNLEKQVKAQETSEQQLVLIKDRLSKISGVRAYPNATSNVENLNSIITSAAGSAKIDSLNINSSKADLALTLLSNEDLKNLMKNLKDSKQFKLINLYSFDFNKTIGYMIKISLMDK